MLKAAVIFLIGIFCGFWFSWLAPRSLYDYWKSKGHEVNKTAFEGRDKELDRVQEGENSLAERVKVLCMVLTYPENDYRAFHIKATWGKRCDVLLFFSTEDNKSVPTIGLPVADGENYDWARTKESFKYAHKYYLDRVHWVLKVDDETYVVVENLKRLLSSSDPQEAVWFGHYVKPNNTPPEFETTRFGYMDERAGYVLSAGAVRRFVEEGLDGMKKCLGVLAVVEDDLEMGKCMEVLKVKVGDSNDSLGRGRFYPLKPYDHVRLQLKNTFWNFTSYIFFDEEGFNCCSDLAITFHDIRSSYMYTLEYFLYHLQPYGVSHNGTGTLTLDSPHSTAIID